MFCRNCGKEIPNGTNFCNHCGAAQNSSSAQDTQSAYQTNETQHSSVNSQSVYTDPAPRKPKRKGPLRIIIPIVVIAVAFAIGYFATGANKLKQPTAFDEPSNIEFGEIPSPSIKESTTEGNDVADVGQVQTKTFRIESDAGTLWATFYYEGDGVVRSIMGGFNVNGTVAGNIDDIKSGAESTRDLLIEMGVDDSSFINIIDEPDLYRMDFTFSLLERNPDLAEVAAEFLGLEAENGKIMIDSAEQTMLDIGYTLQ